MARGMFAVLGAVPPLKRLAFREHGED